MNDSKPLFTVFCASGDWQNSEPGEVGTSVSEICDWLADNGYKPVAWIEGDVTHRYDEHKQLHEASIAAGRTIEKIDGKWVAFGGEMEKVCFGEADDLADWLDPNAGMIARDGITQPKPAAITAPLSTSHPPIKGLCFSADLNRASHQIDWRHGSAHLG